MQTVAVCEKLPKDCPIYIIEIAALANEGAEERKLVHTHFRGDPIPKKWCLTQIMARLEVGATLNSNSISLKTHTVVVSRYRICMWTPGTASMELPNEGSP